MEARDPEEGEMPDWTEEVRQRLSPLRLSPARETEIVDELSQHLDDRWRELIAGGASAEEATKLTLDDFSDADRLARYMAPLRQAHSPSSMTAGASSGHVLGDLWQDLRYAVRVMAARPGFAAVAILSLALGIGANSAIFGLWNGVLHASLPDVEKPEQLVMLSNPDQSGSWTGRVDGVRNWLTYEEFEQIRDHAEGFSGVMASQSSLSNWQVRVDDGRWEEAGGRLVSGGFFEVLGVGSAIGRVFTTDEDRAAAPDAVISYSYWQRRFGGRFDAVGRTLTVRKTPFTIIGVASRGFIGETSGQQPDVWLPLRMQPMVLPGRDRLHDTPPEKSMWLHVFGRLKPGVTAAQTEGRANAIFQAGLESFYGAAATGERRREILNQSLQVRPAGRGASATRSEFSQSLTALLAAVGVVLLITCANLANLLLARGTAREPEIAVRLSLGASRGRLIRQLVTESLTLAAIGAVAAVCVAFVLHRALVRMMAETDSDFQMTFALDPPMLAFIAIVTCAATVLFGLFPAWQVTRTEAGARLKEHSRGIVGRSGQLGSGRFLVSLQLALSLPLLVGAGLLARTVYNLQRADLGFRTEHLFLVRVDLRETGYEPARRATHLRELVDEIQRIPGVRATSFSQLGVFSGGESSATIAVEGYTRKTSDDHDSALDAVGPNYFTALGVPLALGRDILDSDRAGAPAVCVINDAFARKFFEQRNPIGMRITPTEHGAPPSCRIVGVAGNARTQALRGNVEPRFFVAAAQLPQASSSPTLLIRTTAQAGPVITDVRRAIRHVDPALPIVSATSIEGQMAPLTAQDRSTARLAVVFGCVALALAAIGLYGVLSYGVARRTSEIAIRLALGAQRGRVVAMILRETMRVVGLGLAVGGALVYSASRLIGSRLYGVHPHDPLTLVVATGLLLFVSVVAAYLPAQRASRLDPMTALRQC
jgi:predicted permease